MKRFNLRTGASLIEILVVIVIFLVGILAIAQIFPGGLNILRTTRNTTMATALARAEMERLKSQVDQLAEAIVPARYVWNGTRYVIDYDLNRYPNDFSPAGAVGLDVDGNFVGPNGILGRWPYLSGPNVMTRVVGESRTIPSPRYLSDPTPTGSTYGGLMACQFAPVIYDPTYPVTFLVYGNDLQRRIVESVPGGAQVRQDYIAFIDELGEEMALPMGPARPDLPGYSRVYRVSVSLYVDGPGGSRQRDLVTLVPLPSPTNNSQRQYVAIRFDDATYFPVGPGETVRHADLDTFRVARVFDQLGTPNAPQFLTEDDVKNNPSLRDDASYQYDFLDDKLGLMLFNPVGFNYQERRGRGRVPLRARVDYDVYDWRIIRDEFRVPRNMPFERKLILNSIKVRGNKYSDQRPYTGIGFRVANETTERDFVLVDTETGGVIMPTSYAVDKSSGVISFIDDPAVTNQVGELGALIMYPKAAAVSALPDIRGRSVRALYQGVGEWAVQVEKAVRSYQVVYDATPGLRQCYVGGSNPNVNGDRPTRVYFPLADIGKQVLVGEIWYDDDQTGTLEVAYEQQFLIQAPRAGELPLGFIDVRDVLPASSFNFSNGYAVRRVRGASVGVRAMWNPLVFNVGEDPTENMNRYHEWERGWRKSRTETFLMGGMGN
ncbi:MAG TPA: hypothetical protein PLL78_03630 [Fimbriimonadaceae bacterium]|nr:hypothetical protein [Fimbriimonadaceae bacterium]HRJ95752.1 hypothetical protein [Fimbriimonadaceae bacterium]